QEEDERADAREENGGVWIKTHDDRSQDGGPKHGEHMLQADEDGLYPGQALIWRDDPPCFRCPAREVTLFFNGCHRRGLLERRYCVHRTGCNDGKEHWGAKLLSFSFLCFHQES